MDKAQLAAELHKPFRKPKEFRHVMSAGKDDLWSIDLVDMTAYKDENEGYGYMLTCIDTATRYAWAIPMKNKTATESWRAFKEILDSGRKPNRIWADEGSEFFNDTWEGKLKALDIVLYATGNEKKAVMVERFNRTLKTAMWKKFTENENHKWVALVPQLLETYNSTVHSSIGVTPDEASEKSLKPPKVKAEYGKPKYELREWVRISRIKDKAAFTSPRYRKQTKTLRAMSRASLKNITS